ncbi:MAG: HPP family protein [Microthrixaceae bacterium]|nr:HPP family protein [Microthrixaceae bacterium]
MQEPSPPGADESHGSGRFAKRPTGPGPIGGDIASVLYGIGDRLRIPTLTSRHSSIAVMGLFAMVNGIVSIAVMAAAAALAHQPLVFPSLGPTAFLLFYTPTRAESSPRNAITGHAIGALAGYLALHLFGLTELGPALIEGVTLNRVGAAALSLGLTSGLMVWLRVPHPRPQRPR